MKHFDVGSWNDTQDDYDWDGGWQWPQGGNYTRGTNYGKYINGWNMVWYVSGSDWTGIGFRNLETPARVSTTTNGNTYAFNRLMVGAARTSSRVSKELQGIIHSIRIKSVQYTATDIENLWFRPTNNQAILWDYFTSMFTDFGTLDSNNQFYNSMYDPNGHPISITNTHNFTVDPVNGTRVQISKPLALENVSFK